MGTINIQSEIQELAKEGLLTPLLFDHTHQSNIVFVTDNYENAGCQPSSEITSDNVFVLNIRALKNKDVKDARTKNQAEVYTPVKIVREMLDALEEESKDDFETGEAFIDATILEITCGEGAFIATRYEPDTGIIIPVPERTGAFDRKMQMAYKSSNSYESFEALALRALKATYAYELQGDSLLIARVNMLMDFIEHCGEYYSQRPEPCVLMQAAEIITLNLFQMDGLTGRTPKVSSDKAVNELDMFEIQEIPDDYREDKEVIIKDWAEDKFITFNSIKNEKD